MGGLSVIHRCARTIAQDGVSGGVKLNADDRFCLDGQRLVAVSGTYGANGTEYRTEIDGSSRIISHGTAGSGPANFTVETKLGRVLSYGNTADSRLEAGATVRLWSVQASGSKAPSMLSLNDRTGVERSPPSNCFALSISVWGNSKAGLL